MKTEAKKKDDEVTTKTYTDTPAGPDILNPDDKPVATTEPEKPKSEPDSLNLKKASQSDTLRATSGITPNDRMRDLLSRMRDIDVDPTDAGYPIDEPTTELSTQVNIENLPAVADKALAAAGTVRPDFHKVANLPGNMNRAIRTMGKQLFRMFTNTPTEDIYMIGDVMGMGPNSRRETNAVAGYLRDKGTNLGIGDLDFEEMIPGYRADVSQVKANGIRWLLVRDEFGDYIYAWPEKDSKMFNDSNKAIGRDK